MSVTVIIDPLLREKVLQSLLLMSRDHHRSIARLIRPEHFAHVVDEICEDVVIECPDFDAALVASASRVRDRMPYAFKPDRVNQNAGAIFLRNQK